MSEIFIRNVEPSDLDQCFEVESAGFPEDEAAYQTGLNNIRAALANANEKSGQPMFRSEIHVKMFLGYKK